MTISRVHHSNLCQGGNHCPLTLVALFLVLVAVALACDKSLLPNGTTIFQQGSVLQVRCKPDLAPWSVPHDTMVPERSKRQFGRYLCHYGNTWWRINPYGRENSTFFCADRSAGRCSPLDYNASEGEITEYQGVARWKPIDGDVDILYCADGIWHRLGGDPLPRAVVARNQEAPPTTPPTSVPEPVKMDAPTKSTPSTRDVIEMSPTLDRSSPRLDDRGDSAIAILIPRPTSGQVLNLTRIRSPSVSTIVGFSPSSRALARYYFPAANIVVLEDHLSAEVHDQLIQYIRIAFYCLLIIGLSAVTFGVLAFLHVRRRSAQMARKAAEARQNLGDFPSLL